MPGVRKPSKPGLSPHKIPREKWFRSSNAAKARILAIFFYWKTLPKPGRVPKKQKVWCQNAGGYQKKPKKTKFWSLELPSYPMLQNFGFLGFFGYPPAFLAPKLLFFWDPSRFWEHFGEKPCQNHGGYQKKQKFWCQNAGGYPKNPKNQSFGALGCLAAQDSKTFFFFCRSFLVPSSVLAPFGTPQGFGSILEQSLAETMEGTKKQQFWWGTQKTQKTKVLEHWVAWQLKTPRLCFFFRFFVGTLQRFGTKTFVFLRPLKVLRAFWSKTLPKPWRVPKKLKFWCQNDEGYQKNLHGFGKVLLQNAPKIQRFRKPQSGHGF